MYLFRREDNDQIVEVDFATMMEQVAGRITLPDGATARRCYDREEAPREKGASEYAGLDVAERPIVSDALGFTVQEFAAAEADRVKHGFTGVEFREDPRAPGFYQVHFSSRREWQRYLVHRGAVDHNGRLGSGVTLTQADLDMAAELVKRNLEERK